MNAEALATNQEREARLSNGWIALPVNTLLLVGGLTLFIYSIAAGEKEVGHPFWGLFGAGLLAVFVGVLMVPGFFTLQPNEARVLILFGAYRGTVRQSGFHSTPTLFSFAARSAAACASRRIGIGVDPECAA